MSSNPRGWPSVDWKNKPTKINQSQVVSKNYTSFRLIEEKKTLEVGWKLAIPIILSSSIHRCVPIRVNQHWKKKTKLVATLDRCEKWAGIDRPTRITYVKGSYFPSNKLRFQKISQTPGSHISHLTAISPHTPSSSITIEGQSLTARLVHGTIWCISAAGAKCAIKGTHQLTHLVKAICLAKRRRLHDKLHPQSLT